MKAISLHYNPTCAVCARQARRTVRMDWLGRVDVTTSDSPLGKVPAGKIVVVDNRNDGIYTGIYATRKVCMQIPLFFLFGLVLHVIPIEAIAGRENAGCDGDACEV